MKPIVFAGPSLFGVAADRLAGIVLRPPAECGDILRACREGAIAIGLVDGLFETRPSPWHKEILMALDMGVPVYGGASLGALRAAECDAFGMVGIGRIYEDYRDGRRSSDADVAVIHSPAELGYAPLSVALVDVEATTSRLLVDLSIDGGIAMRLLDQAKSLFFKERTWDRIAERTVETSARHALLMKIDAAAFSQKTDDAMKLVNALVAGSLQAGHLPVSLSRTCFAAALAQRIELSVSGRCNVA